MATLKTFKLTREYLVEAESHEAAEKRLADADAEGYINDWLDQEWWEMNKPFKL